MEKSVSHFDFALCIKRLKAPIHKEFLLSPPDCSAIMGTFGPMGVPTFNAGVQPLTLSRVWIIKQPLSAQTAQLE